MAQAGLFDAGKLGAIPVSNRIAMAPLTRSRADSEGVQTPLAAEYYSQRASAGLIICEATNISRQGRGYAWTPGVYTDAHVKAWRKVTDAVHEAGGHLVLQLWHVGRVSHVSLQDDGQAPVAPSAIRGEDTVYTESGLERLSMPRMLRHDEIPGLIDDYRNAARRAKEAGFDGVEIHMANSYLLDQFLRDSTNRRDDEYGGSVANRSRLPLEVAQAVTEIWDADRVGARLSPLTRFAGNTPLDSDPQTTYGYLAERLGMLGMAYIHCIEGQTRGANAKAVYDFQELRRAFGGGYIANNSYTRELAIETISKGEADMIAFGRPFIGNPDVVDRLRKNAPFVDAPKEAYYGGGASGYTDFATLNAVGGF
ncbi:NADH:flavin oxidoreductase [Caballeronia fortuita]|uniref:NADH:flavin oxidoreductase n=1 Tax=Caballeronia fortuita TaxID=1777138 RepID=A0A158CU41_9BURK|nr:alkene reductase [Caballeronia fortuita]SAK85848.1 NADH:flavin oxidoreductase [Caballeronia fortuita]